MGVRDGEKSKSAKHKKATQECVAALHGCFMHIFQKGSIK